MLVSVLRYLSVLAMLGLPMLAFSSEKTIAPPEAAELILHNGQIYTMDSKRSWGQALAIRDGRIVYVGDDAGAQLYTGSATRVVDLNKKMVLPGFQDTHIHPVSGGLAYTGCALFDIDTLAQVLEKVAQCSRDNPEAAFIRGTGWNWGIFLEGSAPDRAQLDAVDSTRPIILGDSDGHTLWLNSAALAFAGIDRTTPQPEGGEFGRNDAGELTGMLMEGPAMDMVNSKLPALTIQEKAEALLYTQRYLHSLGITAIQDAYVRLAGNDAEASLEVYRSLQEKGMLDLRVVAALAWEPGAGLGQIDALRSARDQYSDRRLQATAVKFWADGILESHTAKMLEPYTDEPENYGLLMVPQAELMAAVPALDAAGFQIHIHAIGDATVRYALDAFEAARKANGVRDSRHLTAHTQIVHPDDTGRFGSLNVMAGFSPYWAYADSYVADINPPQIGEQRMAWMYPIRSIIDSGGRVVFGSDWSVSTADPLLGIETAVTRYDPEPEPGSTPNPVFLPKQRITLDQALAGYTINAAYANFLDADTGSLEVGKYADLVVISDNLFNLPVEDISESEVTATLIEGELVYGEL